MTRLLSLGVFCVAASSVAATPSNALTGIRCKASSSGVEVVVQAERPPVFTVFRLSDPDRLVVDVAEGDVKAVKGNHPCEGPVTGVVATQFADATAEVGRLLVGLNNPSKYDVRAQGTSLVIAVGSPATEAAPKVAAAEPQSNSISEPGVVASRTDEQPVANPASALVGLAFKKGSLTLTTDGEIAKFDLLQLENPPRIAVDLHGVKNKARVPRVKDALVRDLRLGSHEGRLRIVLETMEPVAYEATRRSKGLVVAVQRQALDRPAVAEGDPSIEIDGQPVRLAPDAVDAPAVEVRDFAFADSEEGGRVALKLNGKAAFRVERPDSKSAVLVLDNARISKQLERSLDTSALNTPVRMVSVFGATGPSGSQVRVVVASAEPLSDDVQQGKSGLTWRLGGERQAAAVAQTSGFVTEATQTAEGSAPAQERKRYVGKRVSFEFKDIDIHNLLRIIAEISKKNIVVGDDVTGKVTVRLRNVPWDQALDLVLRSKALGMEEMGSIVRVAPLAKLEEEAKSRAERKKAQDSAQELQMALVPVNYALANEMMQRVRDVLSARGTVTTDNRTNTLIVRDLPQNMGKIRSLVQSLDTPTPQVLIESRIVEANTTIQREIGIQWGGQGNMSPVTGNPTGLVFPNTVSVAGGIAGGASQGTASIPNYAVSLPVGAGDGRGGALGFIFGSAGGALQLNLRLSALEAQGSVKTISAPKVTTLDNEPARISQGVSIPFSQVSAAGANTQFIEARLSLDVTPHITQDGSVLMKINAQNNQPDPANTGANGQPSIQRKEAQTSVMVKDGDTTVIGGIYVRTGSQTQSGVPILSKIPILGFFFKNNRELETKQELLIFITPRILNRQSIAQNQ